MPNQILTTALIAREAMKVLRNNAVMSRLVYRDYSNEFVAGVGDTVTIRKPATFSAKEFSGTIEVQDAAEGKVDVKLDTLLDVSFAVTSKELTMSIQDFSAQFLVPAMQAFSDKIDSKLIALEKDMTNRYDHTDGIISPADVIAVRKFLTANAAPLTDRNFVYGADAEADLLQSNLFTSAGSTGDGGTALREASLGRKFGLDFYCDQNIKKVEGGSAYTPAIAFHKNAMALVTRPLALPKGAANASVVDYDGFGLRVVYGYDIKTKTDTISIDMLCGVKLLEDKLAAVLCDKRAG